MLTFDGILRRARTVASSSWLRAGLLLTGLNFTAGVLGYVYQVLMGRLLSPADFACYGAMMALGVVCGSPLQAMVMLLARRVSEFRARGDVERARGLYAWAHAGMLVAGLAVAALLAVAGAPLRDYLKAPRVPDVWLFAGATFVGFLGVVNSGFLQGLQRFAWLGWLSVGGVAGKILASVTLIVAGGAGLAGALTGVLAAAIIAWCCGGLVILRSLRAGGPAPVGMRDPAEPFPWRSFLPSTIANVALALLTQIDMVLVNRYFDAGPASQYAAASILGKAVLYLPGGLVLALFPLVAEQHARREDSREILRDASRATLVLCGAGALVYALFGPWLVRSFYGPGYAEAGRLLGWYGFAVLPTALVVVAENFLLAKGRVLFAWLFLALAPIEIAVIHVWHPDLRAVIVTVGATGLLVALAGYAILRWGLPGGAGGTPGSTAGHAPRGRDPG